MLNAKKIQKNTFSLKSAEKRKENKTESKSWDPRNVLNKGSF